MTPPNTELKSEEYWINVFDNACFQVDMLPKLDAAQWIRSIQHNAMLHAAIIAKSRKYNGVDSYGHAYVDGANQAGDDILTSEHALIDKLYSKVFLAWCAHRN